MKYLQYQLWYGARASAIAYGKRSQTFTTSFIERNGHNTEVLISNVRISDDDLIDFLRELPPRESLAVSNPRSNLNGTFSPFPASPHFMRTLGANADPSFLPNPERLSSSKRSLTRQSSWTRSAPGFFGREIGSQTVAYPLGM